jgi:hypothetical protein
MAAHCIARKTRSKCQKPSIIPIRFWPSGSSSIFSLRDGFLIHVAVAEPMGI